MKNFWKNFKRKLRDWNFNRQLKSGELKMTPKGIMFYEYVRSIATNELALEDRIESYEEDFAALGEMMKRHFDETGYTEEELRRIFATAHTMRFAEAYRMAKGMLNGELD